MIGEAFYGRPRACCRVLRVMTASIVASSAGIATSGIAHASTEIPCSAEALIAAVSAANSSPESSTLVLTAGCTYELSIPVDAHNGLPTITGSLTLVGQGATIARTENAPPFRILTVAPSGNLTLQQITVRDGVADVDCPLPEGIVFDPEMEFGSVCGGGIANAGELTIRSAMLLNNRVTTASGATYVFGGAVASSGTVTLVDSTVAANRAGNRGSSELAGVGGGLANLGIMTIDGGVVIDNVLRSNTGDVAGGGIYADGPLNVDASNIVGNRVESDGRFAGGGGIATFFSTLTLNDSVVTDNGVSAIDEANGGGLLSRGSGSVVGSRVSGNSARSSADGGVAFGAGISVPSAPGEEVSLDIESTTIEANRGTADVALGGGLTVTGVVTVRDSDILRNTAHSVKPGVAAGGGVLDAGQLIMTNATVHENLSSSTHGLALSGGLHVSPGADLSAEDTTFSANKAAGRVAFGGGLGLRPGSTASLAHSLITDNEAHGRTAAGGGIFNERAALITLDDVVVTMNDPDNCAPTGTVPTCA